MVLLIYVVLMIGSAFTVASAIYYVVENQLVKAGSKEPQAMSLLASLFGFGLTFAVIYFALLQRVMMGM
jgi:hypothetical protein